MTANDTINTVNEMTVKGLDRMTSLGELNLRIFERTAARQMEAMNLLMEQGIRAMKLASESKGYNELVKGQVEAAKEFTERLMSESKTNLAVAGEVRDDYRAWFETNMAEVSADLRKTSPGA